MDGLDGFKQTLKDEIYAAKREIEENNAQIQALRDNNRELEYKNLMRQHFLTNGHTLIIPSNIEGGGGLAEQTQAKETLKHALL